MKQKILFLKGFFYHIISKRSVKTHFWTKFAHRVSLTAAAAQFLRTAAVAGERSITRTLTRTRGRWSSSSPSSSNSHIGYARWVQSRKPSQLGTAAAAAVTVVAHGSRRTARGGGQLRSKPKALPFKAQSTKSPVCSGTRTARREPYATAAGTAVPSMEFRTRFFDRHIACGGPFAELCSSTKKLTKACCL